MRSHQIFKISDVAGSGNQTGPFGLYLVLGPDVCEMALARLSGLAKEYVCGRYALGAGFGSKHEVTVFIKGIKYSAFFVVGKSGCDGSANASGS